MKIKYLLLLTLALTITGCSKEFKPAYDTNFVKAFYWHGGSKYSAAIEEGNEIRMHYLPRSYNGRIKFKILKDLKQDEELFYSCDLLVPEGSSPDNKFYRKGECTLHIHSLNQINPSDWSINRGKFGTITGKIFRVDK